jgi:branched-chain amino acid transport system substrate-binding protein
MFRLVHRVGATVLLWSCAGLLPVHAQQPLRIGVIALLSGPAAEPFGVPAGNASDLIAEALNQGAPFRATTRKASG